jgi:hypothetical protein
MNWLQQRDKAIKAFLVNRRKLASTRSRSASDIAVEMGISKRMVSRRATRVQRHIWYRLAECVAPEPRTVRSRMYLARNAVMGQLLCRPRLHRLAFVARNRETRLSGLRADLETEQLLLPPRQLSTLPDLA